MLRWKLWSEKGKIKSNFLNVQFADNWSFLSLFTFFSFWFGAIEVKAAYIRSGLVTREFFVRTPDEYAFRRGQVWKLRNLPYGTCEARKQWAHTIKNWLLQVQTFTRVNGVSWLPVKRSQTDLKLLIPKLNHALLVAEDNTYIERFRKNTETRFNIVKMIV